MDIIGDADELGPVPPEPEPARRRALVQQADLLHAVVDGLIALGAAIAVAALGLVIVVHTATSHASGGPGDFFAVAVWLTGASLGVPVHLANSATLPGAPRLETNAVQGRAVIWLLTAIVLILTYRLTRRRERLRPSASLAQLSVRALLTALAVTLLLLVLALATTRASVFGRTPADAFTGVYSTSSIGLEPGFVFAGPLLLTAIAALAGAATATTTATTPRGRAASELARWGPVFRLAGRQVVIIGAITGVTLLVYACTEIGQHSSARATAVAVIGLTLLLPNLAIYGTLGGFGTTFFYGDIEVSIGPGIRPESSSVSHSVGLFGSFRPWIVWLILAAAVAGTLLPALMARRAERSGGSGRSGCSGRRSGAGYPLPGVWRAALTGLVTALAVVLLGTLSYAQSTSSAFGPPGSSSSLQESLSAGPSLLAAAGLAAVWFSLCYLAASIAMRSARPGLPGDA